MRVCVGLFFLFSLSFGSIAFPAGAQTVLPTADDIEAKATAAIPPLPTNYRETITSSGAFGFTKTVTYAIGKDVRRTHDRGGIHREDGTYQGDAWHTTKNGLILADDEAPGKEAPEHITTTVTRVTSPLDAYVVSHMNIRKAGTRTFYDPATFRVLRVEYVDADGTEVETYDDFAAFGNVTRAKRWTTSSKESKSEQHFERVELTENAATDKDIQIPDSSRTLVEFPAGVTSVQLPATFNDKDINVRLTFGKRTVDFILDTGASSIVIDEGLARELGLTLTNATSEVTTGRYTAYDTIVPELAIGPLHMHNIAMSVAPVSFSEPGFKPLGLLGFDFLAQLGVTIDYQRERVTVTPTANYDPPTGANTYPIDIRIGAGVPMTTVSVRGAVAEHMIFDTGWSGQLAFFDFFSRRYPDAFRNDLGPSGGIGIGGPFTAEMFKFENVSIGKIHFLDYVGLRIPSSAFNYDSDGAIGNELLSLFTVGLNYTNARMYLTVNAAGIRDSTKSR